MLRGCAVRMRTGNIAVLRSQTQSAPNSHTTQQHTRKFSRLVYTLPLHICTALASTHTLRLPQEHTRPQVRRTALYAMRSGPFPDLYDAVYPAMKCVRLLRVLVKPTTHIVYGLTMPFNTSIASNA